MNEEDISSVIRNLGKISFEDRTALVTGGSGFLGSWICDVLVNQGAKVICIDNFSSGRKENILHLMRNENFHWIEKDVSIPFMVERKIDYVFHLASRASPLEFEKFPIEILKANSLGTLHALNIARKNNASFLFTSTSEIYGDAQVIPTPETYNGNVNPIGIRGCYDESKRVGEAYCMAYFRQHQTNIRIARIFNTYGPRMRSDGHYGRVIPRFIDQAIHGKPITIFGNGSQTRSFCYVTDQIEGLLKLASLDGIAGEVVNIGTPEEVTILELANLIKSFVNSESELYFQKLPPDDPKRRCPIILTAWTLLKWKPKIELSEGLKKTITYMSELS